MQRLVSRPWLALLAPALALILGLRVSPATAAATTIRVPADFVTIQGAIDAALDGDLILVSPDVYTENLTISGKTITLASEFYNSGDPADISSTIIDGGGGGAVIIVNADVGPATTIMGFTIRNATDGLRPFGDLNILNNIVIDTSDGIDYEGGGGVADTTSSRTTATTASIWMVPQQRSSKTTSFAITGMMGLKSVYTPTVVRR